MMVDRRDVTQIACTAYSRAQLATARDVNCARFAGDAPPQTLFLLKLASTH
jgi:hypothetical protein